MAVGRLALGCVLAATVAAPARAMVIVPGFASSITGAANATQIEKSINTAVGALGALAANPGSVNILFELAPGNFLGASASSFYTASYGSYTGLLAADVSAHPGNSVLATAVASLAKGNDADGSRGIVATSADLRVGLGVAGVTGCFDSLGGYVSGCGQTYDGVILLSSTEPLDYTRPVPKYNGKNLEFDAVSVIEHEVDEVLGGGGSGSTLNDIAEFGLNNPADALTSYDGVLDLYRYAGGKPSFATASNVNAYLSFNGGATRSVGFNQNSRGDYGDFGPTTTACSGGGLGGPAEVQSAFSCNNQTANVTGGSVEWKMLEAIGYDATGAGAVQAGNALPVGSANALGLLPLPMGVPEPGALALLGTALLALLIGVRRRA